MSRNDFVFADSTFFNDVKNKNINANKSMVVFKKTISRVGLVSITKKIIVIDTLQEVCKIYFYLYDDRLSLKATLQDKKNNYKCINKIFNKTNNGVFIQVENTDINIIIDGMIEDEEYNYIFYVKYIEKEIVSIVISKYPISCLPNEEVEFGNDDGKLPNIYYSYFPILYDKNCND